MEVPDIIFIANVWGWWTDKRAKNEIKSISQNPKVLSIEHSNHSTN